MAGTDVSKTASFGTTVRRIISDPTGEAVFDAGNFFGDPDQGTLPLRSFPAADVPIAKDGTYPFVRYVIRTKGKLEVGGNSCATFTRECCRMAAW